ncbi:MAG: energy-coupling factor ABC transporter permease [Deltaproteobacteria bacterium]|nr:energy-coupling factor ABC transporter permease [Deltaproteobacteria bacterium]
MHIAEGILPLTHAAAWSAVSAPLLAVGARRFLGARRTASADRRVLLGMAGALTFAFTLFPVPVPVAGATSHMCATPVLALLVGAPAMVVPAAITLLLQALFFAHGGLTPLGANVLTLGVVGPWVGWAVARAARRAGASAGFAVALACGVADLAVYAADAVILALALSGERGFGAWFGSLALAFAPTQVPLALIEALLSAGLIRALARRRPDLVPSWLNATRMAAPRSSAVPAALLAAVIWAAPAGPAAAEERFLGLDETVIEAAGAAGGRPATGPVLDVEQGDLLLFVFSLGTFVAGVVVGVSWTRLTRSVDGVEASRAS